MAEGMPSNRTLNTLRSFSRKHKSSLLRKKCGAIKHLELYQTSDSMFVVCEDATLVDISTILAKFPVKVLSPSLECTQQLFTMNELKVLHISGLSNDTVLILLQSAINCVFEREDSRTQRRAKQWLFQNKRKEIPCFIFLDLLYPRSTPKNHSYFNKAEECVIGGFNALRQLFLDESITTCLLMHGLADPSFTALSSMGGIDTDVADITSLLEMEPTPEDVIVNKSLKSASTASNYQSHLTLPDIEAGLRTGALVKGAIKMYSRNPFEGEVTISGTGYVKNPQNNSGIGQAVLVSGQYDVNRALDGDIVAVRLYDRERWGVSHESLRLSYIDQGSETTAEDEEGEEPGRRHLEAEKGRYILLKEKKSVFDALGIRDLMPTGRVVGVIRRRVLDIYATIPRVVDHDSKHHYDTMSSSKSAESAPSSHALGGEESVLAVPIDRRLPKFRMRTHQGLLLQGQRILIRYCCWPQDSFYPQCTFVTKFGEADDWRSEVDALLAQCEVFPRPFSLRALACLPVAATVTVEGGPTQIADAETARENEGSDERVGRAMSSRRGLSGWTVSPDQLHGRKDLRGSSHRIFSVDPPGCQDIDDAMSVRWTEESSGELELTVSIADVGAFVQQGSALDKEAQERGTTVYLPHCRYDMLPSELSSDIASLHCDQDRLAVALIWRIKVSHKDGTPVTSHEDLLSLDGTGEVNFTFPHAPCWMGRAVIRSIASMTYLQANNLILGRAPDSSPPANAPGEAGGAIPERLWSLLRHDLRLLVVISRALKRSRMANGAVDIPHAEGSELRFKFNEDGLPDAVKGHEALEVHDTIEELMILANSAVARYLQRVTPLLALIRVHAPISISGLKDIRQVLISTLSNDPSAVCLGDESLSSGLQDQLRAFREKLRQRVTAAGHTKKNLASHGDSGPAQLEEILGFVSSALVRAMNEAKYVCAGAMTGSLFSLEPDEAADPGKVGISPGGNSFHRDTLGTGSNSLLSGHYGLGLSHYTHFTSPIRRFADLVVHRQLLAALDCAFDAETRATGIAVEREGGRDDVTMYSTVVIPKSSLPSLFSEEYSSSGGGHFNVSCSDYDSVQAFDPADRLNDLLSYHFSAASSSEQDPMSILDDLLDDADGRVGESIISADDLLDGLLAPAMPVAVADVQTHRSPLYRGHMMLANEIVTLAESESHRDAHSSESAKGTFISGDVFARSAPYQSSEVVSIASHLNDMNRRAKKVQKECQRLFLNMYFRNRVEARAGIVCALRENGFLVYITSLDFKGAVYLEDARGVVCLRPSLLRSSTLIGFDEVMGEENHEIEFPQLECILTSLAEPSSSPMDVAKTTQVSSSVLCIRAKEDANFSSSGGICSSDSVAEEPPTNSASVLQFSLMDPVVVSITAAVTPSSSLSSVPEIRISLLSVGADMDVGEEASRRRTERGVKGRMSRRTASTGDATGASDISKMAPTRAAPPSTLSSSSVPPSSMYQAVRSFQRPHVSGLRLFREKLSLSEAEASSVLIKRSIMRTVSVTAAVSGKKQRPPDSSRYAVPRSGRFCFWKTPSTLPPLFKAACSPSQHGEAGVGDYFSSSGSSRAQRLHEAAIASLGAGVAAARARMEALGERWAAEEELPGMDADSWGGINVPSGSDAGVSRKELGQLTARMSKLKVAKKSSRYK